MDITSKASEYVFQTNTGYAPNINLNLGNASLTAEAVESAIAAYESSAEEYANNFRIAFANKEYIAGRLMNDLCLDTYLVDSANTDLSANAITLHAKANEVYSLAVNGKNATSLSAINGISSNFNLIYSAVCVSDDGTSTSLVDDFEETAVYDAQAVTLAANETWDGIYIKDVPNAVGNNQSFTCYAGDGTAKYTLAYNPRYEIDSATAAAWVISENDSAVAYTTAALEQSVESGVISNAFPASAEWTPIV